MRVGFSVNSACQPLRPYSFGKAADKNNSHAKNNSPAFTSDCVSRQEYDKLYQKYDLACRLLVVQRDQYKELADRFESSKK